jgi:hypothetical protein
MKKSANTFIIMLIFNSGIFSQTYLLRVIDGKGTGLILQRVPHLWAEGYDGQCVFAASIDEGCCWKPLDLLNNLQQVYKSGIFQFYWFDDLVLTEKVYL